MGNNAIRNVANSTVIGEDMWKQLKRVSIPTFTGDKQEISTLEGCISSMCGLNPCNCRVQAVTVETVSCLAGEALKAIEGYVILQQPIKVHKRG